MTAIHCHSPTNAFPSIHIRNIENRANFRRNYTRNSAAVSMRAAQYRGLSASFSHLHKYKSISFRAVLQKIETIWNFIAVLVIHNKTPFVYILNIHSAFFCLFFEFTPLSAAQKRFYYPFFLRRGISNGTIFFETGKHAVMNRADRQTGPFHKIKGERRGQRPAFRRARDAKQTSVGTGGQFHSQTKHAANPLGRKKQTMLLYAPGPSHRPVQSGRPVGRG